MIFVNRNAVNPPWDQHEIVRRDIEIIQKNISQLNDVYQPYEISDLKNKIYKRDRRNLSACRKLLYELFNNKCAYCEQCIPDIKLYIDSFRPAGGIIDLETGKALPLHYLWLKNSWDNMYLSCPECNARKRNKFPIAGQICELFTMGDALAIERPLLLDPCDSHLNIEDHLDFKADGMVYPLSERGEVTINVFGLNRPSLISARARHARQMLQLLQANADDTHIDDFLKNQNHQFLGLSRQLFSQFKQRYIKKTDYERKSLGPTAKDIRLYDPKIKSITIKDIGPISGKHVLELCGEDSVWLMLLGDNGVGKSTVLKLTALLLVGEKKATQLLGSLNIHFQDFLNNGAKLGYIILRFTHDFPELTLTITPDGAIFSDSAKKASKIVVNAYGASRLHPNSRHVAPNRTDTCFIDNLFDSFEPLSDVSHSIIALDEQKLAYSVESLSQLLGKSRRLQITKNGDGAENVRFTIDNKSLAFNQLSDGFKSIVSLYMDIANTAMNLGFERAEDFNGIVIIDELGTHLHPRWRMKIVSNLRQLFPLTQFLCSTHEPLCLRGLKDEEVRVLRQFKRGKVKFLKDLPPVSGLTAEQLLTSAHFGLSSTIDPEVEAEFSKYYELLYQQAKGITLTEKSAKQLEQLRHKLVTSGAGTGIFSGTRRDQLVYEVVDRLIAANPERDAMNSLDEELIAELDALWTKAAGRPV